MKRLTIALILMLLLLSPSQAQDATETARASLITLTAAQAGQATALPAEWNAQTPILWLNQQAQATAEAPDSAPAEAAPEIAPEATVSPVTVNIEMPPATSTQTTLIDEDAYIKTLDRLTAMIETLVGFIPAGAVSGLLITLLGVAWVITRLTPTKKDDEIFDRLWAKIEEKLKG